MHNRWHEVFTEIRNLPFRTISGLKCSLKHHQVNDSLIISLSPGSPAFSCYGACPIIILSPFVLWCLFCVWNFKQIPSGTACSVYEILNKFSPAQLYRYFEFWLTNILVLLCLFKRWCEKHFYHENSSHLSTILLTGVAVRCFRLCAMFFSWM